LGPAVLIVASEAALEDGEDEFEVAGAMGAVYDGEDAGFEGGCELAGRVAVALVGLDGDDRGRGIHAAEEFEDLGAGGGVAGFEAVHGHAEVDQGDVDWVDSDGVGGFGDGFGLMGPDAEGFEEFGEAFDPRAFEAAGVGEEKVEFGAHDA
jgi:hypothetical protein